MIFPPILNPINNPRKCWNACIRCIAWSSYHLTVDMHENPRSLSENSGLNRGNSVGNIPMAFRYALSSSISHASGRILRYACIIEIGLASFSTPLSLPRTSRTFRSRLGVSLRGSQAPITPAAAKCDPLRVMECANYNICWIIGGRLAAPADAAARCTGYNTCICIGIYTGRFRFQRQIVCNAGPRKIRERKKL